MIGSSQNRFGQVVVINCFCVMLFYPRLGLNNHRVSMIFGKKKTLIGGLHFSSQSRPAWFKISMGPKMVLAMEL
ncbi:MAG: hypothetical protein K8S18_07070 [Desulfobacula sp.]|nr:hypothetical protein [Desulfobacula sp.]